VDLGKVAFLVFAVLFSAWLVRNATKRPGLIQKARPLSAAVLLMGLTLAVVFT
jgi:hypothetical protein